MKLFTCTNLYRLFTSGPGQVFKPTVDFSHYPSIWTSCGSLNNCVMVRKAHAINSLLSRSLSKQNKAVGVPGRAQALSGSCLTELFNLRTVIKHSPAREGSFILVEGYHFRNNTSKEIPDFQFND